MEIAGEAWRMRISIGESDRWHPQSLAEALLQMAVAITGYASPRIAVSPSFKP